MRSLLAVTGLYLAACASPATHPRDPDPETTRGRAETNALTTGAVAAAARDRPSPAGDTMRVHFIDVGQGDATLFEFPCAAVLVDTGGEQNDLFSGRDELEVYLADFFAGRPDLNDTLTSLIITHPHIDHTRGVRLVRDIYPPRNVVTNGQTGSSGGAQQRMIHRYAADHENGPDPVGFLAVHLADIPARGLTGPVIDPVDCGGQMDPIFTALWGQVETNPGWRAGEFDNANNHCVVLRVDYGQSSVLLTGDLEEDAIEDLIERYDDTGLLDVDVYQAGHHGSINGTTEELVDEMTPELAVISMGSPDRELSWSAWAYGHPRQGIVDMLQGGIVATRDPINVRVGLGARTFQNDTVTQAVYGTGWDGTVVIEAGLDGQIHVISGLGGGGLLDLNAASVAELDALPGIGPVKAQAIVNDRDANGPLGTVDDLVRVRGIGPATVEALRPHVTVGGAVSNDARVNLNTASVAELDALPRIGPALAQRIVDDRSANGLFASVDDLERVRGIGEATINALRARVTVGPSR